MIRYPWTAISGTWPGPVITICAESKGFVSISTTIHLVRASVLSRLDYCNNILFGRPDILLNRLQSVMNVALRLIYARRWNNHVTPRLKDNLHWLKIKERIMFHDVQSTQRPLCPEYRVFPHSLKNININWTPRSPPFEYSSSASSPPTDQNSQVRG